MRVLVLSCDAIDALPWPAVAGFCMFVAAAFFALDAVWGPR